jgi:guanylate kinase
MKGTLVVVSAPSGGGKNTVVHELQKKFLNSARMVTSTTREPRSGEVNGEDYFFRTYAEFQEKISNNELIEYNEYAGNFYGIEKEMLGEFLRKYDYVFATIDVHGKEALDDRGIQHISLFLLPESEEILKNRIKNRSEIDDVEVEKRLFEMDNELKSSKKYDFLVVNKNGKLDETVDNIVNYLKKQKNS